MLSETNKLDGFFHCFLYYVSRTKLKYFVFKKVEEVA